MYIDRINSVIDYIESHLTDEISYRELAALLAMSVYELRRIFAFMVGTPLSDYIRQRRLTSAVFDLQSSDATITAIAEKYRYDSPSSFSRAFREMQGISPSEARQGGVKLKSYPRATFTLTLSGAENIDFRLVRRGELRLCGHTGISSSGSDTCCEEVWEHYYDSGCHDRLDESGALAEYDGDELGGVKSEFAAYTNYEDSSVSCTLGALVKPDRIPAGEYDCIVIPAALWGVFEIVGAEPRQINDAYFKTVAGWLESSIYERDPDICNLEAFPADAGCDTDSLRWQIYYPLRKKRDNKA